MGFGVSRFGAFWFCFCLRVLGWFYMVWFCGWFYSIADVFLVFFYVFLRFLLECFSSGFTVLQFCLVFF